MSKIIGVTGGIGSGKTTLTNYIASKSFPIYIADDAGKRVMEKEHVIRKVNNLFNNEVLLSNGTLDRNKIGSIVFNDKILLEKLIAIVHPEVAEDFKQFLEANMDKELIFKESAILFESGSYKHCDATILITAPIDIRIQRVVKRDGVTTEAVVQRMKNQLSDEKKAELSTFIVENVVLKDAFLRIDEIIETLLRS